MPHELLISLDDANVELLSWVLNTAFDLFNTLIVDSALNNTLDNGLINRLVVQ